MRIDILRKLFFVMHELLRRLASFSDYLLWLLFDPGKFTRIKIKEINKILIVLINQGKGNVGGDFITLGVINYFKKSYPHVKVSFLSDKNTIKQFGEISNIEFIEDKGKESIKELKRKKFDAGIFLGLGRFSIFEFKFIPYKVGFTLLSLPNFFNFKNRFGYSKKVYLNMNNHLVDFMFKMFEVLGFKFKEKKLIFISSKEDEKIVNKFLNKNNIKNFIVIHPGGKYIAESYKQGKWPPHLWNLERYAQVADYLVGKGYGIVITGSKEEEILAKEIINQSKNKKQIINACGKLSLREAGVLLKKAKLLIATDTSIVHIAYQVEVPIIELMGPSIPKVVGAWPLNSPKHKILIDKGLGCRSMRKLPFRDNYNCLKNIKVEEVINEASNLLNIRE